MTEELAFWGDCLNTHHEEGKQFIAASRMGLYAITNCAYPPTYDIGGRNVLDIGGGPVSLLLKCINRGSKCAVVDPLLAETPSWVFARYFHANIEVIPNRAEALIDRVGWYDEAWLYNVLQHVDDPAQIVRNALISAKYVRIFDWLDVPPYPGHPNELHRDDLDNWFGGRGYVSDINENGAVGKGYYGVFGTTHVYPTRGET